MPTSRHGTILVVDDEEIMREILETLLTREGYDVRVASSGAEGLELARALPFDAAIVGWFREGADALRLLRTNVDFRHPGTRVLTVTSSAPQEGKSTIAGHLAVTAAVAGAGVAHRDSQLHVLGRRRRPRLLPG